MMHTNLPSIMLSVKFALLPPPCETSERHGDSYLHAEPSFHGNDKFCGLQKSFLLLLLLLFIIIANKIILDKLNYLYIINYLCYI